MGVIHIDLFSTLDGVAQAPGGPEEDPEGGFAYGGWQAPVTDDVVGQAVWEHLQTIDALMLGRRTYEIFASYWPHQANTGIARLLNGVPKYVVSRGSPDLSWEGSTQLGADLPAEIETLRERHGQTHVIGSVNLVQTLFRQQLFDQLNLWVYPVVLGSGKRVFPDGAAPANVELLEAPLTSPSGAVLLRYGPLPGLPGTGEMSAEGVGSDEEAADPT